eukprot:2121741-Ditylum_brightwellii.AAC.1
MAIYPDSKVELLDLEEDDKDSDKSPVNHGGRLLTQTVPYGFKMLDVGLLKKKGEGIKVCVLDTGYTRNHPDLPFFVDWVGTVNPYYPPVDTHGHGTSVAGVIAALDNDYGIVGVADGAGLAIGPYLEQTQVYISDTIDGIQKCKAKGAKVVNMSYGSWFYNSWLSQTLNDFFYNNNMLFVSVAGNHGNSFDNDKLLYPASYSAVLSVAAVDSNGVRSDWSAKNNYVSIAAPGVDLWTTWNNGGYALKSGTSYASAHVAGIAARVWSVMPYLTSLQLLSFLVDAAQYEHQSYTGYGLVNHGFYTITLQLSGKCLDNWDDRVKLWTCGDGYTDQMFTYDYFNNMIVGSDGKCLKGSYIGAPVEYEFCNKYDNAQKFTYYYSTKQFVNGGGYCLENYELSQFQNNGVIRMRMCHGGPNQKWLLGKDYETRLFQESDIYAGGRMYRTPGAGMWSSMPTAIGDNRLTRAITTRGFAIEYFEDMDYGGWQGIFGSQDFPVNVYFGGLSNDAVSSFKVYQLPDGMIRFCMAIPDDCSNYYDVQM